MIDTAAYRFLAYFNCFSTNIQFKRKIQTKNDETTSSKKGYGFSNYYLHSSISNLKNNGKGDTKYMVNIEELKTILKNIFQR